MGIYNFIIEAEQYSGDLSSLSDLKNDFNRRNITPPIEKKPIIASGTLGLLSGGGGALGLSVTGKLPVNNIGAQVGIGVGVALGGAIVFALVAVGISCLYNHHRVSKIKTVLCGPSLEATDRSSKLTA